MSYRYRSPQQTIGIATEIALAAAEALIREHSNASPTEAAETLALYRGAILDDLMARKTRENECELVMDTMKSAFWNRWLDLKVEQSCDHKPDADNDSVDGKGP